MDSLKIITLNVRGLRNKMKRATVFHYLKNHKYDLICLQEAHLTKNDVSMWEKQWGGKIYYNEGTSRSKGEVILLSKSFIGTVEPVLELDGFLVISVKNDSYDFILANVYAPNSSANKLTFYKELQKHINEHSTEHIILAGDFNCVLNGDLDNVAGRPHRELEVTEFNNILNTADLTDLWRFFHPSEKEFSWSRSNPFIARRLDYCLVSQSMINLCVSCELQFAPGSDHKAVVIELSTDNFTRGPGYWKFNNSYLKNTLFVERMNDLLEKSLNEHKETIDNISRWELCKIDIRNFCIEFGKNGACQKQNEIKQLLSKIKDCEEELTKYPNNTEANKSLNHLKQKVEILQMNKAKGAQIRSRVKWIEEGERNTKYFCNLEKNRGKRKIITRLIKDSGDAITNQTDILEEQVSFYKKLYSQKTSTNVIESTNNFIRNDTFPRLDEDEASSCEGAILIEEATAAIKTLKNGSAPGSDGLTIEFFKMFWSRLAKITTDSFNESFNQGEMSYTQKQGIIILLHKGKDLDRNTLNNWRPITLTNTDYKILAKVLAERLGNVINKLVKDDQVGFIKGRNIATVIRSIDDVINYLNKTKKSGFLLALDYAKAFDSISKTFLQHVFKVFGFGADFLKWVKILNNGCSSSINHGGWISEPFEIGCGIRQGCPFSPLSFVLAVELLAIRIRNSTIKGIKLPSPVDTHTIKIKQMADDTTLFLHDKKDISMSLEIINSFETFSGLKLNMNKTKALRMGTSREDDNIQVSIVNKIKILGIWFKTDTMANDIKENWEGRIEHMKHIIKEWNKRDISIQGKMVVIKTFLISQLVYVMQSICLPQNVLQTINTLLYKFIWQKRYSNRKAFEKVKRKIMEAEYGEGGFNMINVFDFQKYFLLQWAGKLEVASCEQNWNIIPRWHLGKLTKENNVFYINCKADKLKGIDRLDNGFWKEVLKTYLDSKTLIKLEEISRNNYLNQLLFNNDLIKYKGKTLFFQNWQSAGVDQIRDIVHPSENRLLLLDEINAHIWQNRAYTLFEYNALVNSIPPLWIQWIQSGERGTEIPGSEAYKLNTKPKYIRNILNAKKDTLLPHSYFFWSRKLNFCLDKTDWLRAIDTTKESRLRVLHWKILHNIYPTNILLNKMKIKETNKCTYCPDNVDYMEHFFCNCPVVQYFWIYIEKILLYKTDKQIKLSSTDILFGIKKDHQTKDHYQHINLIILLGKMSISIFKKTESKLSIQYIFEREMTIRNINIV